MLTVLCWYFALSVAVGLVASIAFLYGFELCRQAWWHVLMLVCPLSWLSSLRSSSPTGSTEELLSIKRKEYRDE